MALDTSALGKLSNTLQGLIVVPAVESSFNSRTPGFESQPCEIFWPGLDLSVWRLGATDAPRLLNSIRSG